MVSVAMVGSCRVEICTRVVIDKIDDRHVEVAGAVPTASACTSTLGGRGDGSGCIDLRTIENTTAPTAIIATPAAARTRAGAAAWACGRPRSPEAGSRGPPAPRRVRAAMVSCASSELLGQPALLEALTKAAGGGVRALPAQPDRAPRHVDRSHRGVMQAARQALSRAQPSIRLRAHVHLFRGVDCNRYPPCHQRQHNGARFAVNRAWQTDIP